MEVGNGGIGEPEVIGGDLGAAPKEPAASRGSVNEELIWRARAARAEAQVEDLTSRLTELENALESARSEAGRNDQRRSLELELAMVDAIDIETAALVVERVLAQMDEPEVKTAVAQVRRDKPFLFRSSTRATAMSGHVSSSQALPGLGELADEARDTGDRGALLRYLRARRAY